MRRGRGRIYVLAFALAAAGLVAARAGDLDTAIGAALFRRAWVQAPSSTHANDGLGPLFNARSCSACHRQLERAAIATDAEGRIASEHLVLRLSDAEGRPDPVYGRQLQTSAVPGDFAAEGRVVRDAGGGFRAADLGYGPLDARTRIGAIAAPALRGLGPLAEVPDAVIAIQANRKPRDGVRGRVNWIVQPDGTRRAGRFGHKAGNATLREQVEAAFALDLGLSTPDRMAPAGDCTPAQAACLAAPHGGGAEAPEIADDLVMRVTAYLATVPPPPAPPADRRGERLFAATGCAACHRPALPGEAGPVRAFTDLLLHDLGPVLDGGATEPGVASVEWRTAPLWGISRTLQNGAGLLHDGRAASVLDAVRLHGGEGAASRARFEALPAAERARLLAYVGAL